MNGATYVHGNPIHCDEDGHSHDVPYPDDRRSPLHQAVAEILWAITLPETVAALDRIRDAYAADR